MTAEAHSHLRRAIFGNSVGSDRGKTVRWLLERRLNPRLAGPVSRNSILSAPAATLADTHPGRVYILHEYFVPQGRLWEFVRSARTIVLAAGADLLNVTVRDVRQDHRTALAYARQNVFGLVMAFVQQKTAAGESRMRDLTPAPGRRGAGRGRHLLSPLSAACHARAVPPRLPGLDLRHAGQGPPRP